VTGKTWSWIVTALVLAAGLDSRTAAAQTVDDRTTAAVDDRTTEANSSAVQRAGGRDPLAARSKGSSTAPITVYEMSDFQCPFCRRHAQETFPAIEREYVATGKVRWVFINFPLTSLHANAAPTAEFAMCAARQDKFWPVHDLLFRHQRTWAPLREPGAFLLTLADSVGMSKTDLLACLKSKVARQEVEADAAGAVRAGAGSTPTFYIEGGLLPGAQPLPVFRQILDSIYTVKTRTTPSRRRRTARGSTP
jgi:protein-disulfide isomerase